MNSGWVGGDSRPFPPPPPPRRGGGPPDFGVTFPKLKLAQETEISSLLEASVFRALVSRCCASSCSSLRRYYHNLRTGAGILEVDDEEPCAIVLIKNETEKIGWATSNSYLSLFGKGKRGGQISPRTFFLTLYLALLLLFTPTAPARWRS